MHNSNSKTYVNKAISLIQFQKSDINLFIKEKQIIINNIKLSPKFKSNNDLKLKSLSQLKTFIKTDDSYQKEQHLFISEYPSHYPFFLFDNSQIIAAAYFIDTVKIYHGKYIRSCIFYKFGKYDLLQKKNVNAHKFCISLKISYTIDLVNRTLSIIESNSIKKNTNHFLDNSTFAVDKTQK